MKDRLENLISKASLFSEEDPAEVAPYLAGCRIESFDRDELILRHGEYDENCLILFSGLASVRLPFADTDRGKLIEEGDVFGEIAALSGVPRTADVIALEKCEVAVIPRERMFALLKAFESVNGKIKEVYRATVLDDTLRKVHLFAGLPRELLDNIREKARLESHDKGEVIFHEGDGADALYIVLYGYLKVSRVDDRRERVLSYIKGGQYFGETALLSEEGKRTATVSAITRTELVKISRDGFGEILRANPGLRETLREAANRRDEHNIRLAGDAHLAETLRATVETGIIQTKTTHILNMTRCVQCGICAEACAQMHDGVSRLVRKGIRLSGFLMAVTSCHHCDDPACMTQCPTGAIIRDANGEIYHQDFCIGCGSCAKNCPYGNITVVDANRRVAKKGLFERLFADVPGRQPPGGAAMAQPPEGENKTPMKRKRRSGKKMVKCDLCRGYDFLGCVYNCPTGAMMMVEPSKYFVDIFPS